MRERTILFTAISLVPTTVPGTGCGPSQYLSYEWMNEWFLSLCLACKYMSPRIWYLVLFSYSLYYCLWKIPSIPMASITIYPNDSQSNYWVLIFFLYTKTIVTTAYWTFLLGCFTDASNSTFLKLYHYFPSFWYNVYKVPDQMLSTQ